jgi:hypothetical protein
MLRFFSRQIGIGMTKDLKHVTEFKVLKWIRYFRYSRLMPQIITIIVMLSVFVRSAVPAGEVLFREEFKTLDDWKPLEFPKIKQHTKYSILSDGAESYLKAESNASASGIVFKKEFDVYKYNRVRWRWKVSNVFKKGNAKMKSGDDYPLRIYIIFKYDPDSASFGKRLKYGLARKIYGEYPPDSSLNYIWANRKHEDKIIPNAYAAEARMILLQSGPENAGKWIEQEVDIILDYRRAFGQDPPGIASLAIMSDSDNTGESARGFVDYIEVFSGN